MKRFHLIPFLGPLLVLGLFSFILAEEAPQPDPGIESGLNIPSEGPSSVEKGDDSGSEIGAQPMELFPVYSEKHREIMALWESGEKRKAYKSVENWKSEDKKLSEPWVVEASLKFDDKKYRAVLGKLSA